MSKTFTALVVGIIFGAGLALSDMVNPARVLAFLDILGDWDPALVFVMGGAIIPAAIGYLVRSRMRAPVLEKAFFIPANRQLDRKLIGGAALFGVGWGLAGYCPGPAVAGLAYGFWQTWLFVAAMLLGMIAHRFIMATKLPGIPADLQTDS
jgi:uncharacterized membrane protein YedE/YeeE